MHLRDREARGKQIGVRKRLGDRKGIHVNRNNSVNYFRCRGFWFLEGRSP